MNLPAALNLVASNIAKQTLREARQALRDKYEAMGFFLS